MLEKLLGAGPTQRREGPFRQYQQKTYDLREPTKPSPLARHSPRIVVVSFESMVVVALGSVVVVIVSVIVSVMVLVIVCVMVMVTEVVIVAVMDIVVVVVSVALTKVANKAAAA